MRFSRLLFSSFLVLPSFAMAQQPHVHGAGQFNIVVDGQNVVAELIIPAMDVVGFEHKPRTDEQVAKIESAEKTLADALSILALTGEGQCSVSHVHVTAPHEGEGHGHGHDDHDHDEHKHEKHAHDHKDEHHGHDHDEHQHEEHDHGHEDHAHGDHKHDEHEQGHDEHGHDEHGHDEHGHDEHKHGHDDHEHHGHDHDEDVHSEFSAAYEFTCSAPDKLTGLGTSLFTVLPTLEKLEVNLVLPKGQTSGELTKSSSTLTF